MPAPRLMYCTQNKPGKRFPTARQNTVPIPTPSPCSTSRRIHVQWQRVKGHTIAGPIPTCTHARTHTPGHNPSVPLRHLVTVNVHVRTCVGRAGGGAIKLRDSSTDRNSLTDMTLGRTVQRYKRNHNRRSLMDGAPLRFQDQQRSYNQLRPSKDTLLWVISVFQVAVHRGGLPV